MIQGSPQSEKRDAFICRAAYILKSLPKGISSKQPLMSPVIRKALDLKKKICRHLDCSYLLHNVLYPEGNVVNHSNSLLALLWNPYSYQALYQSA